MKAALKILFVVFLCSWMVVSICLLTLIINGGYDMGYRQGQIDALTGNVKYELVTKPDKTVVWDRKGD